MTKQIKKNILLVALFCTCAVFSESNACCTGTPDITLSSTTISQAVFDNTLDPGSTTSGTGLCIFITGTLVVDQDYLFSGIEFRLDKGASIIIVPGISLRILSSNLEGCTYLWREIEVGEGATLTLRNCTISDAYYAVNAHFNSRIFILGVTFDNNYVGIFSDATQINRHRIVGCFFLNTDGDLKDEGLNDPPPVDYSHYGIQVLNLSFINIGYIAYNDYSQISPVNVFDGIHTGISAKSANISVHGCQFKNLSRGIIFTEESTLNQSGLGAPPPNGTGSTTASFQSVYQPILGFSVGSFANIEHNLIRNSSNFGIRLEQFGPESQINISRNNIVDFHYKAIYIYDSNLFGQLLIENNYIEDVEGSSVLFGGIEVSTEWPFISASFIRNNEIRIGWDGQPGQSGVFAVDISNNGPHVLANNIALLSSYFPGSTPNGGIYIHGTGSAAAPFIECNHIEGESMASENLFIGIIANHISSSAYDCNEMEYIRFGARFSGVCSNTAFAGNSFEDHYLGLHLTQSIMGFGPQFHRGNTWSGSYTFGAKYDGNPDDITNYRFFVNPSGGSDLLPPNPVPATGWFVTQSGNTFTCPAECPTGIEWQLTSEDEEIAIGKLEPSIYKEEQEWLAAKRLYRKVEDHNLLGVNTKVDSFYNSNSTTNIGRFVCIEKAFESALKPDSLLLGQLNLNRDTIIYLMDTIAMIEKNLTTATGQDSIDMILEILEYTGQINDLAAQQDSLCVIVENNKIDSLDLVDSINTAVSDSTTQENNIKTYNDIRINYLYKGDYDLSSSQIEDIYDIANQCPYSGGDVVYAARKAYMYLTDSLHYFDDDSLCTQQTYSYSQNSTSSFDTEQQQLVTSQAEPESKMKIEVYPNPTSGLVYLAISQSQFENGNMVLIDVLGNQIINIPLSGGQQKYTIDASFLPVGMYLYKIWIDGKEVVAGKLSIISK